ncbi:hypothetical protein [Mucilaginibacter sp.]|uniref:hypothetical protein n=1 Tax=Mucilaginibacter sp. TaxID=1882438 RepID=UPI003265B4B5
MRKVIGIGILLLSAAVLLTAMNQAFINRVKQDRYFDHLNPGDNQNSLYHRVFIRSDRWRNGDLYGLSYLPQYKFALEPFKQYNRAGNEPITNRVLYIIGDSFLADKTLSGAFEGFDKVIFIDRRSPVEQMALDATKQNYMLLEFAERNLNGLMLTEADKQAWQKNSAAKANTFKPVSLPDRLNNIIFNKDLSRNAELLLFDDKIFTPFKEAKAWLNYALFGRVAKEVAVSTDKKRLLLNVSVDTASVQSAFIPISDKEVGEISRQLSLCQAYYTSIGFKKVFLGVVPNAVSVYDDKRMPYNHLLQRVEKQSTLPVISVYQDYKTAGQNLFYLSDAHWNPFGLDLWVKKTNEVLQQNLK